MKVFRKKVIVYDSKVLKIVEILKGNNVDDNVSISTLINNELILKITFEYIKNKKRVIMRTKIM